MSLFKKLFAPDFRRVKARLAEAQQLTIRCSKCGTQYVLGVDSKLFTHEDSEKSQASHRKLFDVSIGGLLPGVLRASSRNPDLVVCEPLSPEDRQKTIRDLEVIYKDLCSGVGRGWYCPKRGCGFADSVNAYPLPEIRS